MTVRAGIIVTGTEVLGGLIRDANGPWLSEQLRQHGVSLREIVIVGDRSEDLLRALDFFCDVDLVVTSGGLGPTADDLTAAVVAGWVGTTMELDPALEERVWAIVNRLRARVGGDEAADAGGRAQAGVRAGGFGRVGAGGDRAGVPVGFGAADRGAAGAAARAAGDVGGRRDAGAAGGAPGLGG